MKSFSKYWAPVLIWAGLIFYMSNLSTPPTPPISFPFLDKLAHLGEFTILGLLLRRGGENSRRRIWQSRRALLAILLTIGYGAMDELHQVFIPLRTPAWGDLLADGAGAVIAQGLYALGIRLRISKRRD